MYNEIVTPSLLDHFNARNTLFVAQTKNISETGNNSKSSRSPVGKSKRRLDKSYSNSSLHKPNSHQLDSIVDKVLDKIGIWKGHSNKTALTELTVNELNFDRVYDETCSLKRLYNLAVRDITPFLFEGQSVIVTAVGAANSAKSITLWGQENNLGIVPQLVRDLLQEKQNDHAFSLTMQSFAFHNLKYIDLLSGDIIEPSIVTDPSFSELGINEPSQFAESFTQAINSALALENFPIASKKGAIGMRIHLLHHGRRISAVDFWELPDTNCLQSKESRSTSDVSDLKTLFNAVSEHFSDRFVRGASIRLSKKNRSSETNAPILNLFSAKKGVEKLLLICNLSQNLQDDESTLKWCSDLRALIINKGDTNLSNIVKTRVKATRMKNSLEIEDGQRHDQRSSSFVDRIQNISQGTDRALRKNLSMGFFTPQVEDRSKLSIKDPKKSNRKKIRPQLRLNEESSDVISVAKFLATQIEPYSVIESSKGELHKSRLEKIVRKNIRQGNKSLAKEHEITDETNQKSCLTQHSELETKVNKSGTEMRRSTNRRRIKVDESHFREPSNCSQSFSCSAIAHRLNKSQSSILNSEKVLQNGEAELKQLIDQSKKVLLKMKSFSDFLNDEDDIFLKKGVENYHRDVIVDKFHHLYKRAKALKRLFGEVIDNDNSLLAAIQSLIQEKSDLSEQLDLLTGRVTEFSKNLDVRTENLAAESRRHSQEKVSFEQKLKYLEQENQNIKAQLSCKRNEIENLQRKLDERDQEVLSLKINQEIKSRKEKTALDEEIQLRIKLEERIKYLEEYVNQMDDQTHCSEKEKQAEQKEQRLKNQIKPVTAEIAHNVQQSEDKKQDDLSKSCGVPAAKVYADCEKLKQKIIQNVQNIQLLSQELTKGSSAINIQNSYSNQRGHENKNEKTPKHKKSDSKVNEPKIDEIERKHKDEVIALQEKIIQLQEELQNRETVPVTNSSQKNKNPCNLKEKEMKKTIKVDNLLKNSGASFACQQDLKSGVPELNLKNVDVSQENSSICQAGLAKENKEQNAANAHSSQNQDKLSKGIRRFNADFEHKTRDALQNIKNLKNVVDSLKKDR